MCMSQDMNSNDLVLGTLWTREPEAHVPFSGQGEDLGEKHLAARLECVMAELMETKKGRPAESFEFVWGEMGHLQSLPEREMAPPQD